VTEVFANKIYLKDVANAHLEWLFEWEFTISLAE
jgi:hypothetical protein